MGKYEVTHIRSLCRCEAPSHLRLGLDGRRARTVVHERKLAKRLAVIVGLDLSRTKRKRSMGRKGEINASMHEQKNHDGRLILGLLDKALCDSRVDHIEEISCVALSDEVLSRGEFHLAHCVDDEINLRLVER